MLRLALVFLVVALLAAVLGFGMAVGVALEALKYVNLLISPLLAAKLRNEYGVFQHAVTILLWSFVAAMIVLAGAHWTARHGPGDPLS